MNKKKAMMIAVLFIMVLSLAGATSYYWYMQVNYVMTDAARVDADIVNISPQISGKILNMYVAEGDAIKEGAIVARQANYTLNSGLNEDLAVIKSPVSGTVIKKIGNAGEVGIPGQPVAMITDLKSLYISADIEETELHKVKVGQLADFTIDAFPGVNFTGQVISIEKATVSTFSLLPAQNTGGNYTKVVQRIRVNIGINQDQEVLLLPGMNAIVKIHLK